MEKFSEAIWFSEKRKNLLLLLLEGPKTSQEIESEMKVSWRSMTLPVKELKEMDFLLQEDNTYRLSPIGQILMENAKPIANTMEVLDKNMDYWTNRNLKVIPQNLRTRLGELGDFSFIEPGLKDMFELPTEVVDSLYKSTFVMSMISFFHPFHLSIYTDILSKGTKLWLVLTESVWARIEEDFKNEADQFKKEDNIEIFIYNGEFTPPSIIISDVFLFLSIFNKENKYDHRDILSFDERTFLWGKELFSYYLHSSKKVI